MILEIFVKTWDFMSNYQKLNIKKIQKFLALLPQTQFKAFCYKFTFILNFSSVLKKRLASDDINSI